MEQWRWMPADMGELYVWNNIPEYTQRVVKGGAVLQTERIVAGEIGKQTPIFTRPMRRITFRPTWKVPESIKVRELWPSLLQGGGLMREWDLEIRTKDGQLVDWRKLDWTKTDIREYDVIQPNGPKSVMGKVKFSFPNPAHRLHARHAAAGQIHVQRGAANLQPRLHAGSQSDAARGDPAA